MSRARIICSLLDFPLRASSGAGRQGIGSGDGLEGDRVGGVQSSEPPSGVKEREFSTGGVAGRFFGFGRRLESTMISSSISESEESAIAVVRAAVACRSGARREVWE